MLIFKSSSHHLASMHTRQPCSLSYEEGGTDISPTFAAI